MRKEIILAIILGIILGGVIIFGINLANRRPAADLAPALSMQSPTPPSPSPTLQITSPLNNSVSFQDSLTLTGKTLADAWIALIWEDSQTIIQADETGNWEQEINLVGGENIINITTSNGQDYQESTEITVIYTTAQLPTPTTQETASPSTDVNENLKQRIQEIVKDKTKTTTTLKGYAGVITKINDINLVINISPDKTLQITTNDTTTIVRLGKEIPPASLSIDEKVIIIGLLDTDEILSAKRIVTVKDTTPTTKRQTTIGSFSSLNADIPKKSNIDVSEITENQIVMAIIETDLEDNTNTLLLLQKI